MTHHATAHWEESSGFQQEHITQVSPHPTWEAYYNYAQQLYAAGHQRQAEAYYRQARLLYEQQTEKQQKKQRQPTNTSYSYSAPQSNQVASRSPVVYAVSPLMSEDIDDETIVQLKDPPKKRTKARVVTILTIVLLASISGVVGLFFFYRSQLKQGPADIASDGSIFARVQDMTLKPMVNVLRPAFDKTIRLSQAVQPLLYELKMRKTLPDEYYVNPSSMEKSNKNGMSNGKEANLSLLAENNDEDAIKEIEPGLEKIKDSVETSPPSDAPDNAAENVDALAEGRESADEASEETVAASNEDEQDAAEIEEEDSSSRSRARRSSRRRSRRARRHSSSESFSNSAEDVEPIAPPENLPPFESAAPPAEAPPRVPPPPPSNPKTRELDDLLAPKPKAPQRSDKGASGKTPSLKENLSRADVQSGMARVAPAVKRCGQGKGGTISMNVVIGKNGRVSKAVPTGIYANTPIGSCAAREIRRAVFPASQKSLNVKYPFRL